MNYKRFINKVMVRATQFSDHEFHIFVGSKLYAIIDNIGDAYREYNNINESTLRYMGF